MNPALKAYLDHQPVDEEGYAESRRLKDLIPDGLLAAHRAAEKAAYFVPENERVDTRREHLSPCGQYRLITSRYGTKPGAWDYSQGKVYRVGQDEPLAIVNRNYGSFPFEWVAGFLVCGENYQGQTVIDLNTGERRDHLSTGAEKGHGFCWAEVRYDAASKTLVVCGCCWACPCEYRFFDFSSPMQGWPELETGDAYVDEDPQWPSFEPDGTIRCYQTESAECDHDDCPDHCEQKPMVAAATQTFRREGQKLVLASEWVSDLERANRAAQEEGNRRYDEWRVNFRATDPLYLTMLEHLKDPAFKPDSYDGIGVTYKDWCPDFKGEERRMCRRIMCSGPVKIDLEWGAETAPIKLVVFKGGNHPENRWFEHSVAGMDQAFAYAKAVLP